MGWAAKIFGELGIWDGLLAVTWIGGHIWVYKMYNDRLKDRQEEIDRLAADNRDYRDRFLHFIDERMEYSGLGSRKKRTRKKTTSNGE